MSQRDLAFPHEGAAVKKEQASITELPRRLYQDTYA